ncbi:MAG TPA: acyltransferase [Nannocystaceae bacterium]|nr:acyltransferase [Nannocystaceae bacterium]
MSKGGRLDVVQVLRFVAASLVVVAHAESRLARVFAEHAESTVIFALGHLRTWGHFGVDLFFAISGFIMYWVTRGRFQRSGASLDFLRKRVVRVVPIYWGLTAFAVGLLAVAPSLFSYRESLDTQWIAASFLFVPWQAPEGFVAPVLGLGWTLNYEVWFYLCFALLLLLPERRALPTITIAFVACALLGQLVVFENPWTRQATSWLLLEFVMGLWIAHAYTSRTFYTAKLARVIGPLGLVALFATIFFDPAPAAGEVSNNGLRFLAWGIPSAAVLFGALSLHWQPSGSRFGRVLVALGDASYSIYLLQVFALPGIARVLAAMHLDAWLPFDVLVLLLTAGSIAVGYVFYLLVERPLTRALQRRGHAVTAPTTSTVAA